MILTLFSGRSFVRNVFLLALPTSFVTPQTTFCRSDASLWEISLKLAKGKLEYESSLAVLYAQMDLLHLQAIPITPVHIERAVLLPPWHQDPFDRMMVAQAQVEGLPLISCDTNIRRYDVNVLW